MKSFVKQTKMIIIIIGFIGICSSCSSSLFAGILYPKVFFDFNYLGERPPSAADDRLALGAKYPQFFTMSFMGPAHNSFETSFFSSMFANKPYSILSIREMSYTWQEGEGVFFVNELYYLDWHASANGWHWNRGFGYYTNFEKIFKNKKQGDTFWFTLKIVFSLDGEPEQTQILKYNVVTYKNEYVPLIQQIFG